MESEEDLRLVASTSFDPVDDVLIKPLPVDKEEEEHTRKDEEQRRKEEEEWAEIEAARKEYMKIILSRMKFMRKIGRPATLMYCKNLDPRKLLNRKSTCTEEIDWVNGPIDKEIMLEKEKTLWNAAMEYRKVKNMYFFLKINMALEKTDTVTACIVLDDDVEDTCNACPSHSGILHPCKGGFTCGSKEGPSKEDLGGPKPASAFFVGGTSRPGPAVAAAIGTPESKSLTVMPNGRPEPITKRQ